MNIYSIDSPEFCRYGRVLNIDAEPFISAWKTAMPEIGSAYEPSSECFEGLPEAEKIKNELFGSLPTQTGCCYGHSNKLNALEWHKSSEINIALTDLILLLGDVRDIEDGFRYDSGKVQAFRLKKGEAIEVYATTMHFCPIETSTDGFACVVALPLGTNVPLAEETSDKRLFRQNKWIIACEDNSPLIERGVLGGIYGTNYTFNNGEIEK